MPVGNPNRIGVKLEPWPGNDRYFRATARFNGHIYEQPVSVRDNLCQAREAMRSFIESFPDEYVGRYDEDEEYDDPFEEYEWDEDD